MDAGTCPLYVWCGPVCGPYNVRRFSKQVLLGRPKGRFLQFVLFVSWCAARRVAGALCRVREFSLQVRKWVAWVPGIDECAGWGHWSTSLAAGQASQPDIAFIPALVRRRLSPASRLALRVAHDCLGEAPAGSGVFCSRHGECNRTLAIFDSVAAGQAVSPTQFSQSVHNTAAGVFSIERQLQIPFTAIAAGAASGEHGFIEAAGLVAAGQGPVLLVLADDRPVEPFAGFCGTPEWPFGLALLLEAESDAGLPVLTLQADASVAAGGNVAQATGAGTDNLLAFLTGQSVFRLQESNGWRWSMHGR